MSLHDALSGMREIPQWFIWRLEWNAQDSKYQKTPCAMDGSMYRIDAGLPSNWKSYSQCQSALLTLNSSEQCSSRQLQYALGFWLTPECGYWFFDLDKCGTNVPGELTEFAAGMVAAFPGAFLEWSSSRQGIHIIGRCSAAIPPHRSRDINKLHMEFYTEGRGIAFGLDGSGWGSADTVHDAMIAALIEQHFPPRAVGEHGEGARPEWRGPADDEALIAKMLGARQSAESVFGGKLSVGQLWRGECEHDSNADMALASHLAFWTGCDEERMERLMRRSGLVREKWNVHKSYLRDLTIRNACASCGDVYQEPERNLTVQTEMYGPAPVVTQAGSQYVLTPEMSATVHALLDMVSACGTIEEMHNHCVPAIHAAGVPGAYHEQLVRTVNGKLDFFGSKMPIGKVRALLFPPALMREPGSDEAPLWLQKHCYVKEGDIFFDLSNGSKLTYQGFIAEYSRLMPLKQTGGRENPVEWAFTRWNITTVHHLGYRPDRPAYFQWDGLDYANLYSEGSVPAAAAFTQEGIDGIASLQAMMFDMCGRRQDVFLNLLWWFAHNVQKPGVKIRWSPLLKGAPGDAKTILSNVLRAAMGYRNVSVTGNSTLRANGGFNDWAVAAAANVIEEIHLTGKDRYQLYNAMKEFISNDVVNVNAKGGRTYNTWNVTNHWANTNHNDAIPLEPNDRRWFVIFTPWASLADMARYCGLTAAEWAARTKTVDNAWRNCGGQLRAWFLSLQIGPAFDADGSAMMTAEKMRMMASSQEDAESVADSIIAEGMLGITRNVISSSCLSTALRFRAAQDGLEVPKTTGLNHMLTRMGFSKLAKQVKWNGIMHTVWIKNGFTEDTDAIRLELNNSKPTSSHQ